MFNNIYNDTDMITLLGIDYCNGDRTSKKRFKPQRNLTMQSLERIRERELKKLTARHPDAKPDDIQVCFIYQEE